MTTYQQPQNSLQTLLSFLGQLLSAFIVIGLLAITLYGTVWLLANMAAAFFMIMAGVKQSINAHKNGEKPQVSSACLNIVFYMMALPIMFFMFYLSDGSGDDIYGMMTYKVVLMFTAYLVLRENVLPLLMRRSTWRVHAHAAAILALCLWPCYAYPLYYVGVPTMLYGMVR